MAFFFLFQIMACSKEIYIVPNLLNEIKTLKSSNSKIKLALIGDSHARRTWKEILEDNIFDKNIFKVDWYGQGGEYACNLLAQKGIKNEMGSMTKMFNDRPNIAILIVGSNDLTKPNSNNVRKVILDLFLWIGSEGITVFVAGMPERWGTVQDYHQRSSTTNRYLSKNLPEGRFINWPKDCLNGSLVKPDKVHLEEEGYKLLAKCFLNRIEQLLGQ